MSLTSILSAEAIENAVKDCQAPDSFCYKKFFQLCGLSSKTPQEIKDVFQILDEDNSGYIEESELKYFLQRFVPGARTLTEAETKTFISAADDNNDGRVGVEDYGSVLKFLDKDSPGIQSLFVESSGPSLKPQESLFY